MYFVRQKCVRHLYKKINDINRKNRWIAESFKTCGIDPWSDTTEKEFHAHLEKLSESRVYKALIDQHTAVQLSKQFDESYLILKHIFHVVIHRFKFSLACIYFLKESTSFFTEQSCTCAQFLITIFEFTNGTHGLYKFSCESSHFFFTIKIYF